MAIWPRSPQLKHLPRLRRPERPLAPEHVLLRSVAVVLVTIASMAAAAAARPLLAAALAPTRLPLLLGEDTEEQLLDALLDAVRGFLSVGVLRHTQPADKLLH